ncbi:MAG: glycosyltransferase family 1 protein [Bacteroidetes bacterium]|nr:glycosyltransferase family 1 protein [Bacteroidota bacterium]
MNYSDKTLHIVSFNVPYPPDYGGVIDVFYKIKALHDLGIKIHLHCFNYGRDESEDLGKICEKVYYYPRKKFYQAIYSKVPYIVGSRQSDELLSNLTADNHPILFEGMHTCFYLKHPALKDKIKTVRMHNVEWDYYRSLKEAESNYLIKFYFNLESKKLKKFEDELKNADKIFAISKSDYEYLRQSYETISYVPAFHNNETVTSKTGKGNFILYQGNLSVVENNQAAMFIAKKIAEGMPHKFVFAGKNPTSSLKKEIKNIKNIELIENPPFEKMAQLIADAQINLLLTFQSTGIKLKLLNSLYRGRFVVVNGKMVNNTGLEELCIVEDNPNATKRILSELMEMDFTQTDIEKRKIILDEGFGNRANAMKIANEIFGEGFSLSQTV